MCFSKLQKVAAKTGDCVNTTPGFSKIYFADIRHISAIPAREDYAADQVANLPLTISADVTFDTVTYTDAGWYQWDVQKSTADLKDNLLGESKAKYLQTEVPFNHAGHNATAEQHIEWAINLDLIALMQDRTGLWRLVGDLTNPLEVGFNSQYGLKAGDFTGYEFAMTVDAHPLLWPYYTGAITPVFVI